ncbi:MAG TPA: DUF302 domain-containing protein [Steroidobacteraceae bacterium]|nr:DUF302 domain-containing protein [Steroidobacteraceae bacterium]
MNESQVPEIVEHESPFSFGVTLARLVDAITKSGMTVFASIDHAANARSIGATMPPTTVLLYGNAKGGTPIMLTTPQAALDLPLRVLVRESLDGKASIAFHPITTLLGRIGVSADAAARLEPAQRLLSSAISP